MRVGVVGCGSIGRRHIGTLLALGCVVRASDVSLDACDRVRAEFGIEAQQTLALTDLDAIIIATPYAVHLPWVEEAIRRNLPFFVEKPLGSLEQLPRWRELAIRKLPVHQVGYNCRFTEAAKRARGRSRWPWSFGLSCDIRTWPGVYGHPLLECSHEIDLALWAGASPQVMRSSYLPDSGTAEMRLPFHTAGVCIDVRLSWLAPIYLRVWREDVMTDPHALAHSYVEEMRHFLAAVFMGRGTTCQLKDGLNVLEVCQQVLA